MLKSVIELIPYGYDADKRPIAGFYLANLSIVSELGLYDYLIAYFELPCQFNDFKQVEKYLLLANHNRNLPMFNTLACIFNSPDWCDSSEVYFMGYGEYVDIIRGRAGKDKIFEVKNA